MTNELDGRALAEAAARSMGWTVSHSIGGVLWQTADGRYVWDDGDRNDQPSERECSAWLLERGIVNMCSAKGDVATQFFTDEGEVWPAWSCKGTGSTLLEALQRLVVAVAAREQAAKGEP